jgi:hypothetical protein
LTNENKLEISKTMLDKNLEDKQSTTKSTSLELFECLKELGLLSDSENNSDEQKMSINIKKATTRKSGTSMVEIWKSTESFSDKNCRIYVAFNTGQNYSKCPFVLFGLYFQTKTVKYIKSEDKFLEYLEYILKAIDEIMKMKFVENEESLALQKCLLDVKRGLFEAYKVNLGYYQIFCDHKMFGGFKKSPKKLKEIQIPNPISQYLPKIGIPRASVYNNLDLSQNLSSSQTPFSKSQQVR